MLSFNVTYRKYVAHKRAHHADSMQSIVLAMSCVQLDGQGMLEKINSDTARFSPKCNVFNKIANEKIRRAVFYLWRAL